MGEESMAWRGERYRRCLGSNTCVPTGCRRLLPDGTALTRARCSRCCLSSSHSLRRTSGLSGSPCLTSRRIQGGRVRCTSFHRASPSASPTGRPNRRRRNRGQGRPTRTERTAPSVRGNDHAPRRAGRVRVRGRTHGRSRSSPCVGRAISGVSRVQGKGDGRPSGDVPPRCAPPETPPYRNSLRVNGSRLGRDGTSLAFSVTRPKGSMSFATRPRTRRPD